MLCTNPKTSFLHVSITLEKTEWSFIDTQMVEYKDKVLIKKKKGSFYRKEPKKKWTPIIWRIFGKSFQGSLTEHYIIFC